MIVSVVSLQYSGVMSGGGEHNMGVRTGCIIGRGGGITTVGR